MTNEEKSILQDAFITADGQKALEVLRKLSGVGKACYFAQNEREQAYILGKIDFFREIEKSLNENQIKVKNGRRNKQ